jgi:2-desacetyl-2-hydroxyethyl bacteriochlorophyllide A dehydrogenase
MLLLAARYYGIGDIRIENLPKPVCGPGQALIKVAYAGICGSDLHIFRKGMFVTSIPETMGHEFSGVVEQVGEGVTEVNPGDHVVGDPRVSCGACRWCGEGADNLCPGLGFIGEVMPGCFAEYLVLDEKKLIKVPGTLDLRRAALVEPMAVALHIADKGRFSGAKHLGVVGAGPIGLLTVLAAKAMQVRRITVIDVSPDRLALAGRLGAVCLDSFPTDLDEAPDVVVEAVGLEATLTGALEWLEPRGRLVMAGLYEEKVSIDPNEIVIKELELAGEDAYETADLHKAVELLAGGMPEADQMITHMLPLESVASAFKMLTCVDKKACKILLAP